jgi:ribonucleoside-diphosphate reductase 2, operon protein nrdI
MTVYFDSKTGNVARFIEKVRSRTGWECVKISDSMLVNQAGHLVTYTTKIGSVPETTARFMERNSPLILSVSSSGNLNWGQNYGLAGNKIAEAYHIPLLLKFELSGLEQNVNEFILKVKAHADKKMDTPQQ